MPAHNHDFEQLDAAKRLDSRREERYTVVRLVSAVITTGSEVIQKAKGGHDGDMWWFGLGRSG